MDVSESRLRVPKKCLLGIWFLWEALYHKLHHLSLRNAKDLLYYKIKPYHGRFLPLHDGEGLHRGDLIVELHFNNKMLLNIYLNSKSHIQMASILIRTMKRTFIRLNAYLEQVKNRKIDVRALYGVSLLHQGAEQFGFDVIDLPAGQRKKWLRFFMLVLLIIVHPDGGRRLTDHSKKLFPMIIVSSTKSFRDNIVKLSAAEEKKKEIMG
ncbi:MULTISPECIES: YkoP family protein [unclassified Sporolactobacillus]|uniref:YkoP family protein n=1 Tax=unclassified Sporolactobacillus TaxID=2628533 RepID=UPI002367F231|nr:hypothetical protein [Sporolactobacillus sp. CQH2019]MDD9149570.1 hypothetical protein [Sporolactobacillus sp. CQH2019]